MKFQTIRNFILIVAFLLIAGGAGYNLGKREAAPNLSRNFPSQASLNQQELGNVDLSLFWEVWKRLGETYIDKKALDPQKMVWGAISGMVESVGDPYTVFLTPNQQKEAKEDLSGTFQGIGAELGIKEKRIVVVTPLKDTPAEKAGLRPGDWIMMVDGKETANWTLPETVSKIRGREGTKVTLTILREQETKPREMAIIRDNILVKSVEWTMRNGNIAYLKLSRFGDQTNGEWEKAVGEITAAQEQEKVKGLVLDLRNNPGGYLTGAVFIAGEFLPEGTLVVQQEKTGGLRESYKVNRPGKLLKIPLVILLNKGSASASEIVAGALRDQGRAKLVGETSFGKGSIQEAEDLPGGAGLHVTFAKWLLPKGDWINGTGIKPDFEVKMDENNPQADPQLEKAMEMVVN